MSTKKREKAVPTGAEGSAKKLGLNLIPWDAFLDRYEAERQAGASGEQAAGEDCATGLAAFLLHRVPDELLCGGIFRFL